MTGLSRIVYENQAEYRELAEVLARRTGTEVQPLPGSSLSSMSADAYSDPDRNLENPKYPARKNESSSEADLILRVDHQGLTLIQGQLELRGDYARLLPRLRRENLNREMIVRAAKLRRNSEANSPLPVAVDATAGLGEDSLLLAAYGYEVHLYERDPVIAAMLRDTLRRARKIPELEPVLLHMKLIEEDSIRAMRGMAEEDVRPEVILLDPMFPERRKSGKVKKKLQLIQKLERPCEDEAALLQAAINAHPGKIIVKRPLKGPDLAGVKPGYSIRGKAVRYDCIVVPE